MRSTALRRIATSSLFVVRFSFHHLALAFLAFEYMFAFGSFVPFFLFSFDAFECEFYVSVL